MKVAIEKEKLGDNFSYFVFRIIIFGGGIGGYIFFVIVIVDVVKAIVLEVDIWFVGVKGKMEMEKVFKVGYFIEGLWISGF